MTMMMRRKMDSHMRKRLKNMMRNMEMESIYEKQVTIGAQTAKSTAIAQHVKLPIHKTLARFGYQQREDDPQQS
ncbi:hypothetical protein POPTR_006G276750v4 [Populus trichocarpa]|uniref:Uncharacterized protein n=1 Tax=Populus trichocarpa TaxID=3694 RepID=A0ACC0SWT4_POPTR|nr:hypothetical protein BDE02_06G243300 [Populus trichocarpa]KAI9393729.1 hypothetical protein POPTR_006G276750v4 [Populus trichocarpa]